MTDENAFEEGTKFLFDQMQVCHGLEEERLLLSGIECSKVLIER